jgi:hypothetical protein
LIKESYLFQKMLFLKDIHDSIILMKYLDSKHPLQ